MAYQITRRELLSGLAATAALGLQQRSLAQPDTFAQPDGPMPPLQEFEYSQVSITGSRQQEQRQNVESVLLGLDEDSLLKPFLAMAGRPAPGASLGGWYAWKPDYDYRHDEAGFAPGHALGQWVSAMARLHASAVFSGPVSADPASAILQERVQRLVARIEDAITPEFFAQTRFPGYTLDKLNCGFMDAHRLCGDPRAFTALARTTDAALPSLPGHAIEREVQFRMGKDPSWMWDEHYTLPENLFLLSDMGAGERYRDMAQTYLLDDVLFAPLARGENALADRHAYSHVNALCSAMQAYFVAGSSMHLKAAVNGFAFVQAQSFATGGWGPEETLRKPGYGEVYKSLTSSHASFEAPCGGYAHLKLTRYLLSATRDGRYGDSMERMLLNALLGVMPLQADGHAFYSADYNTAGKRVYSLHPWPCCAGTLPQVVADYGINTYLREPGAVWVNLYQPSEVRWNESGHSVSLRQPGNYPESDTVKLEIAAAQPAAFTLNLRIPGWAANGAALRINGQPQPLNVRSGFAAVRRIWRQGDSVELRLPMSLRLEPLPDDGFRPQVPVSALMYGPWVLFPLRAPADIGVLALSGSAMLNAKRDGARSWTVAAGGREYTFVPFTDIGDRSYSTYVQVL